MKFTQKFRKIYHDVFYSLASKEIKEFALKCQSVTAEIDLHEMPATFSSRFRLRLHLSFCQACKNYYEWSKALSRAVKKGPSVLPPSLRELNKKLLEKYGPKENKHFH